MVNLLVFNAYKHTWILWEHLNTSLKPLTQAIKPRTTGPTRPWSLNSFHPASLQQVHHHLCTASEACCLPPSIFSSPAIFRLLSASGPGGLSDLLSMPDSSNSPQMYLYAFKDNFQCVNFLVKEFQKCTNCCVKLYFLWLIFFFNSEPIFKLRFWWKECESFFANIPRVEEPKRAFLSLHLCTFTVFRTGSLTYPAY